MTDREAVISFAQAMALAEVAVSSPTKRDKQKAAAWTALALGLTPAPAPPDPPLPPPPPPPPTSSQLWVDPTTTGPRPGANPTDKTGSDNIRRITDTVFTGTGGEWGIYTRGATMILDHCEFTGDFNTACAWGDNLTLTRCNLHHFTNDAVKLGNKSHLIECWIHDCAPEAGAHADGVQVQNGIIDAEVSRCLIDMGPKLGNSALFIAPDLGPNTAGPVTVADNYFDGGNATVYIVDGNNGQYHIDVINVTGNRWGRSARYAPLSRNVPCVWSDNTYLDGTPIPF